MKKEIHKLGEHIKELVDQLVKIAASQATDKKVLNRNSMKTTAKGASGGLSLLINEGFFDSPKDLNSTMERLKEIGRYYPRSTVSMNLLNFTKRRTFNRIKNKESGTWQYVLRK